MAEDYTWELVSNAVEDLYNEWRVKGLSDDEIIRRITDTKLEKALEKLTDRMSEDSIDWLEHNTHEQVIDERARATEFMARNEQLWNKGFIVSEALYLIVLESARAYSDIISEMPEEKLAGRKYIYSILRQIHGRACQQFLEILHLLKGGFADGAYARWRSLYELSVISEFIRKNNEEVAKAYYGASFTDDGRYGWAGSAPCFSGRRRPEKITFEEIKNQCSMSTDAWNNQYRLANKVVHATPQGTFDRLGVPSVPLAFTPVGRSDYGLAPPAINAAISLSMISADFFISAPSGDGIVYIKTIAKWSEIVRECYSEIEEKCFNMENDNAETSTDIK